MKNKKEKGITLIALVVTVIVLLILATVTISIITGDDGVIDQARDAKSETEISQWEERIDIAILNAEGNSEEVTMDTIIQELINRGIISDASKVDKTTGDITTNDPSYVISGKLNDYIAAQPTVKDLKVGDKVYYIDKGNTERECYVLYDSTSPYGVQIITKDVADTVTLGSDDPTLTIGATDGINDPITTSSTNFEKGRISYNNAVRTLYNKAQEYLNTSYASSARCVGSKPDDPDWDARVDEDGNPINEASLFTSSYSYMSAYNNTFKVGEGANEENITDWIQMGEIKNTTDVDIKASNDDYWLALGYVSSNTITSTFFVRNVSASGSLVSYYFSRVHSYEGTLGRSYSYGFRPVFTLKSNIKINARADGSYDLVV